MEYERNRLTIWGFLKGLFKVVIGFSLLAQSLLFLLILIFVIGIISSASTTISGSAGEGPSVTVPQGSALVLNPRGILVERAPEVDPFDEALASAFGAQSAPEVSVHELVRAIRLAEADSRISTLVLNLQGLAISSSSTSKAHYLASAVESFRESGKRVISVSDFYGQEQYLVASEADTIVMHDHGMLVVEGYGRYRTYYLDALETLKVTANIFRVGTYKSALEPFLRNDMSPEAAEANAAYLDVLWSEYLNAVDANRGDAGPGAMRRYAENAVDIVTETGGDLAEAAVQAGLIDQLADRGAQIDLIANVVGRDAENNFGFNGIGYRSYLISAAEPVDREGVANVAVVTAAGAIVDGNEPNGVAAGDYIARQLRDARLDANVRAVVLRVDSPGGSAFASEIMRDELLNLKNAGKPVVVSMGSLAASGGYWISANADEIWAAPTTITGSIGVFGFIPTFERTAAELGVYTDGVGTTPLSGVAGAGLGPLPEAYGEIIQASVEDTYQNFLGLVAEGRGMTEIAVDEIAQGRVWAGQTATEINLVDKLGSFDDAVASAAEMAGLEDFDLVGLERSKTPFERFLASLAGDADSVDQNLFVGNQNHAITISRLADAVQGELAFFASFNDPNAVYTRCVECLGLE